MDTYVIKRETLSVLYPQAFCLLEGARARIHTHIYAHEPNLGEMPLKKNEGGKK